MDNHQLIEMAISLGRECTSHMFEEMCDHKNRGSKFTWEGFPRICEAYATSKLLTAVKDDIERTLELRLREIARATASVCANQILIEHCL